MRAFNAIIFAVVACLIMIQNDPQNGALMLGHLALLVCVFACLFMCFLNICLIFIETYLDDQYMDY